MKKIILFFILFVATKSLAQSNGITYQAVILQPNGQQLPGIDNSNAPLVDKDICMMFKFIDEYSKIEYQEVIQTKTDQYGMVNLMIGTGSQTDGYATSFKTILWDSLSKSLVVSINTNGSCSSFTEISNQPFSFIPFAYSSINATNVTGVVSIENGGTNATTLLDAKKNLGLERVNNSSDLDKGISTATQMALDLKASNLNVALKAPSASPTFTGTISGITKTMVGLGNVDDTNDANKPVSKATQTALDLKASNLDVALKAPLASPTFTGTVSGITKTMVGLGNVDNTNDANKPVSIATQTALDLKVDKVTGDRLINATEITNLSNQSGANTGDQDLSSYVTNSALDLKANLESPTFTGTPTLPMGTIGVTKAAGNNSTALATTAYVDNANATNANLTGEITSVGNVTAITDEAITSSKIADASVTDAKIATVSGSKVAGDITGKAANVTGIVAIANGGTGSTTQNFVDLTNVQTVAGVKTFSSNARFNGQEIGKGNATGTENLAVGAGALNGFSTGKRNTALGNFAMHNYIGTSFDNNTSVGYSNMPSLTTGNGNTSVGAESMMYLLIGTSNTSLGNQSLINTKGSNNVGIGKSAGNTNSTGNNNTIVGTEANVAAGNLTNATALGYGATVGASNTITLGNSSVTSVRTSGALITGAVTYPNTDGTMGQVLQTNGSGVASWSTNNTSQYAQVLLQSTSDTSPISLGGISIRINTTSYGPELEISRVSNSDPGTVGVYATVYKGIAGAFNANTDNSGGPVTPKYGTTVTSVNVNSWSRLLDRANGNSQVVGSSYFKLEADISVYDSSKSYKLTVLTDGWGKVLLRMMYFP